MNLKKIKDSKLSVEELRKRGFTPSGLDYLEGLGWFIVQGSKESVHRAVKDLKDKYKGQVSIKPGHLRKSNGQFEQEVRIKLSKIKTNLKDVKDSQSRRYYIEEKATEVVEALGYSKNIDVDVMSDTDVVVTISGVQVADHIDEVWDTFIEGSPFKGVVFLSEVYNTDDGTFIEFIID